MPEALAAAQQLVQYAPGVMLAAGLVWLASAASWMALPHHRGEYRRVGDEAALRRALRALSLRRGQYLMPWLEDWDEVSTPEGRRRFVDGPVAFLTILPSRVPSIRRHLLLTLAYYMLVNTGIVVALAFALPPGADYRSVFAPAAVIGLLAHGSAVIPEAIWYGKPWVNVLRSLIDALAFALLGAGALAGTWPQS